MPPKRKKRPIASRRKKCHCTPACNAIIQRHQRLRHYKNAVADEIMPSESLDESESHSDSSSFDAVEAGPSGDNDDQMSDQAYDGINVDSEGGDSVSNGYPDLDDPDNATDFNDFDDFDNDYGDKIDEDIINEIYDILPPDTEAQLHDIRNEILTEKDRDNIRAFKLRIKSNMSREAFNLMRSSFSHKMDIDSESTIIHRLGVLTGVEPVWYDCCTNSCIAYITKYAHQMTCPHCGEPRYSPDNRPRKRFGYLPLIPRLQAFFQSKTTIEKLSYRHNYKHIPGSISDVFDSGAYRGLLKKHVIADGRTLEHHFFSGEHDIALSLCLDSYLLYKRRRRGPSATPITLQNYNLPPEIRTHTDSVIYLGIIPGPHGPKEAETFLEPYDSECSQLASGVRTFNAATRQNFNLHAYNLFVLGDIVAIEKMLNIKGHNGFCPCRSCEIKGVRNVAGDGRNYYVPLTRPTKPSEPRQSWDPTALPLRTHKSFHSAVRMIEEAKLKTDKEKIAMHFGIKKLPALRRVSTLDFACSFPWDWMHLLLENIVPNLVSLWTQTGRYKSLDAGTQCYLIPPHIWEEIGRETAAAVENIPSSFVRVLANIAEDRSTFTAESWGFWFIYLAPILLKGRFELPKYHKHVCDLVDIMKICLQFTITHAEIDELEKKVIDWVRKYELYYYQYREERLSACPLTIHALLHIPDDIRFCGPIWTTWTFFMERCCGNLQAALRSKTLPYANLTNRILHAAFISQLAVQYDLHDELSIIYAPHPEPKLSRFERQYPHCEYPFHAFLAGCVPKMQDVDDLSILRPPYTKSYQVTPEVRRKIAGYFAAVLGKRRADVDPELPHITEAWGKVRILNGDSIRASSASGGQTASERNSSFVRYEVEAADPQTRRRHGPIQWLRRVFYGCLDEILVCHVPDRRFWGDELRGKTRLLALITPCDTKGLDATEGVTMYDKMTSPIITDLQTISAVVGRVKTRKKWGIIDRTGGLVRTMFVQPDVDIADD